MLNKSNSFSLIIPTYNEASSICELCRQVSFVLRNLGIEYEIIVVDDNSPDATWRIIQEFSKVNSNIKVIRRFGVRGLGTAVVTGWRQAQGELVGVIDGDLEHPPEVLSSLIQVLQDNQAVDIVVASRYLKGGGFSGTGIYRRITSKLAIASSRILLSKYTKKISDPMSGFFVLRRKIIEKNILEPVGYKILLEVLVKADYKDIKELPYVFCERKSGKSKAGLREFSYSAFHFLKLSLESKQIYIVFLRIVTSIFLTIAAVLVIAKLFHLI